MNDWGKWLGVKGKKTTCRLSLKSPLTTIYFKFDGDDGDVIYAHISHRLSVKFQPQFFFQKLKSRLFDANSQPDNRPFTTRRF